MLGISSKGTRANQAEEPNAASNTNQDNKGLDAYGFPIGTHDALGRKYGQLDDLYTERDKLNAALTTYEQRREALNKEKYAVPLLSASNTQGTLKQEIESRATLIAINQLIGDYDTKIKATEGSIRVNNTDIERKESHYETLKKDRESVSKGGRIYKNKMAYAKADLIDEGHKKSTAEVTLIRNPLDHDAQVTLSCATQNIEKWSNIEATLDAERQKYDDLMKIYRA